MPRPTSFLAVAAALTIAVFPPAAGAGQPATLGATIGPAPLYGDRDAVLWVVNRSTIAEVVTVDVTGDWQLSPLSFTLPPGERQAVKVTPGTADGAVTLRVTSSEAPEPGAERGVLMLGTQLFMKSPPSLPWGVLLVAAILALIIVWRIVHPPLRR